mgnify:CR=1 FL=1
MNAFDSIYANNVKALKEYLENGDINAKNERGMSLLHYAIVFNNHEIFELLLENYININIKDDHGDTPAHYCVINNRMGFLKTLIRYECDLTIKNNDGHTPLFKACVLGRENMVVLLLETQKLDLFETDLKEETVFMAMVRSRNLDLLNKIQITDELVNKPNYIGETPLHIACRTGDLKIINFLIEHHAFVNAKNKSGETPLFYAVTIQNYDVIDILLKNGAVLDCKSTFGDTIYNLIPTYELSTYINEKSEQYKNYLYYNNYPLHYAIIIENLELVKKFCLQRNIEHKDNFGYTPLQLAKLINNEKIIKIINNSLK